MRSWSIWGLKSKNPITRLKAASRLLNDKEPSVRESVAAAIDHPDGIDLLISLLTDTSGKVRLRAVKSLRFIEDSDRRSKAIGQSPLGAARSAQALRQALADESHAVRCSAALALGEIRDQESVDNLIFFLGDDEPGSYLDAVGNQRTMRDCAACALGMIGDRRAVSSLIDLARLEVACHQRCRDQIYEALGELGDARAFDILLKCADDEDDKSRVSAIRALGRLGVKQAVRPLCGMIDGGGPSYDVQTAIEALGELADSIALETLINVLQWFPSPYIRHSEFDLARCRDEACTALGRIGGRKAIDGLLKALNDPDDDVARTAVKILSQLQESMTPEQLARFGDEGKSVEARPKVGDPCPKCKGQGRLLGRNSDGTRGLTRCPSCGGNGIYGRNW